MVNVDGSGLMIMGNRSFLIAISRMKRDYSDFINFVELGWIV